MAVAFDAVTSSQDSFDTSLSWSHSCSGERRALLVAVAFDPSAGSVSSVTYGGDPLTFLAGVTNGTRRVEFWGMAKPKLGANTVAVSVSASMAKSGAAVSAAGVDQIVPFGTPVTASGSSNAPSLNLSAGTDDLVVDALAPGAADPTAGAGQTSRWNLTNSPRSAGSTEPGSASVTMSWSLSFSAAWALAAVAFLSVFSTPPVDAAFTDFPKPKLRALIKAAGRP